jgi:uncharacterized protein (UPF0128 family)
MRARVLIIIPAFMAGAIWLGGDEPKKKRPLTKEQIEQLEALDDAVASVEDLQRSVDNITRTRGSACVKAFGHGEFCACLNKHMAIGVNFEEYVAFVTRSRPALKYETLPPEVRRLVDNAVATREQCVSSAWGR